MRWLCVLSSFKFRFMTRQVGYTNESFIIKNLLSSKFLVPEQVLLAAWRRSSLILFWCRWVCWCSSCTIFGLSIPSFTTLFELLLALMLSLVISGFLPWWVWVVSISLSLSIHENFDYKRMVNTGGSLIVFGKNVSFG